MKKRMNPFPGGALLTLLFMALGISAYPQGRTITGKITGKDSTAIGGASVQVKGTDIGTLSAADGSFSLSAPANAKELTVSAVGYEKKEILLGRGATIDVSLHAIAHSLDEVVVIGYGTQKRKDVTSAVTTVKAENFNQGGARNALDLIQGKVAGLTITRTSASNPNSGVAIQLRGVVSVSGSIAPLIVIDGIPGGNLDLLQQDDIESFDVLKDGSAAAIYGTRANGGVILVTTRQGRPGPPRYGYSTYVRKEWITKRPDFMTAADYRAKIASGQYPQLNASNDKGASTDFFNGLINHDNLTQYHNLSLSGGTAATSYRASLYYSDLQGVALMNNRRQYGARLNINQHGLNGHLHTQIDLVTNFNKANLLGGGGWEDALIRNPTLPMYDSTGKFYYVPNTTNPVATLYQQKNKRDQQTSSGDMKFTLDLLKGLRASVLGSIQRDSYVDNFYATIGSEYSQALTNGYSGGGQATKGTGLTTNYAVEPTVEYAKEIAKNHRISAVGGYSYQYNVSESYSATNYGFVNDLYGENNLGAGTALPAGKSTESSSKSDNKLIAFFGRLNYSYKGRYMAQFVLRHEGSSRFGANHKWGDFPAVSAGWNITEESFMKGLRFINNLKLRAGYGITGNSGIDNYQSLVTLSTGGFYLNPDGVWRQTYGPSRNPNPDLRWERKQELNIGIDFSLLGSRLNGSIDAYSRKTTDLLYTYNTQLPPFIQPTLFTNVGAISNKGLELTLDALPVQTRDFSWYVDITASTQQNKMISFSNDVYKVTYVEFGAIGGYGALGNAIRTVEGGNLGNFYGKRFAGFDANGKWLFYKADGHTKVPLTQITDADKTVIGNGIPKYYYGINNSFVYKNFSLRVFFRGRSGYQVLNTMALSYGNRTYLPGNVLRSAFTKYAQLNDTYQYSDYYLEPGGFLKLDNLTLGYKIDIKSPYVHNLFVYANGANLATITKYTGNDPDFVNDTGLGPSVDSRGPYPSTRQFTLGLNVGF